MADSYRIRSDIFGPTRFPLAVLRYDPQLPVGRHGHDFSELVLITGGSATHVVGDETYRVGPGDVFLIQGRLEHAYRDTNRLALINVLYRRELLEGWAEHLRDVPGYHVLFTLHPGRRRPRHFVHRLHLSASALSQVCGWVEAVEKALKKQGPGYRFLALAHFMQIVATLSLAGEKNHAPASADLFRVAKAAAHIEEHYREPIGVETLAALAQTSTRHLRRLFRKSMGEAPLAYILRRRLTRAAELLRSTTGTITDIAFEVGFQDSNYFARQFRRVFGCAPGHYRRSLSTPDSSAV